MSNKKVSFLQILALAIPPFMIGINLIIMGVIIEPMSISLHVNITVLQWFMTAYAIGNSIFLITAGRFADIYGRKKIYIMGIILFTVCSMLIAISYSPVWIIIWRLLQGVGGAMVIIGAIALATHMFPPKERGVPMGAIISGTGLGMALGPVIGGFLVNYFNWHIVFWINVPFAIIAAFLAKCQLVESKNTQGSNKLDYIGFILLTTALVLLTSVLSQGNIWGWGNFKTLSMFAAVILLSIVFVVAESKHHSPIIEFKLFLARNFIGGSIVGYCCYFVLIAWLFLFGIYLQKVYGLTPQNSGIALLPFSLVFFIGAIIVGKLIKPIGHKPLILIGFLGCCLAFIDMSFINQYSPYWVIAVGCILLAIGFVLTNAASIPAALEFTPPHKAGIASGKTMMFRWLGGATGTAIIAAVFEKSSLNYLININPKYINLNNPQIHQIISNVLLGKIPYSQLQKHFTDKQQLICAKEIVNSSLTNGLHISMLVLALISIVAFFITLLFIRSSADEL